jgi:hypothetical protein
MRNLTVRQYPGHASFRAEYERHPEEEKTWRLSFYGFAKDTTAMSRATSVRLQADGIPLTPTLVESKTRQLDTSVLEIKQVEFTSSAFRKIATAQSVTVSIGSARFELNRHFRKDMRLILERVSPGQGPPTASTDSLTNQ